MSKLGVLIAWNKWGLRLSRAKDGIEKESKMNGYDVKTTLWKGIVGVGHGLVPVILLAAFSFLTDGNQIEAGLKSAGYSPGLIAVVVPVLVGLSKMGLNWLKNRNRADASAEK